MKKEEILESRVGLGCMRMSISLGQKRKDSIDTIHKALDSGVKFVNTGTFYGLNGHNEKLIAEAIQGYNREEIFISLKYGDFLHPVKGPDVGPKNAEKFLMKSLKRLNTDYVDLYQPARVDVGYTIEETMDPLVDLVKRGLVKHIGLSEVNAETLRKAHEIHPISFVEVEMSILYDGEDDLVSTAQELGIGIVAFGVLGLGKLMKPSNDPLITVLKEISDEKNASIPQLALAWVLRRGNNIVPLIGAQKVEHFEDSINCLNIDFTDDDITRINEAKKISNITGPGMPKMIIKNRKIQK